MTDDMGQPVSKVTKGSTGIVITLDALGTLYRFKKPVADQYIDVARKVGLTTNIEADQLSKAFRRAYKEHNAQYPNYGLGKLHSPEQWWNTLVGATFSQVVKGELPDNLGRELYDHFSSSEAYELWSDVRPFLQSMHMLRGQFSDPKGPAILTGIITNSDPRVRGVLSSLSLSVGTVTSPTRDEIRRLATASAESGQFRTPWATAYEPERDFDFLTTGYESGTEKPDPQIWKNAGFQAAMVALSKAEKGLEIPSGYFRSTFAIAANTVSQLGRSDSLAWIHIGDEYEKDYVGAKSMGHEALLLDREGEMNMKADKITSLEEAAVVVNLMAQELYT